MGVQAANTYCKRLPSADAFFAFGKQRGQVAKTDNDNPKRYRYGVAKSWREAGGENGWMDE